MQETRRIGELCRGLTDAKRRFLCEGKPPAEGNLILQASVTDPAGNTATAHQEWFFAGTEPPAVGQTLAADHARILVPAQDELIVLDPDIPPSRQRVVFEAEAAGPRSRWVLDGTDMGPAAEILVWEPSPGRHSLSLVRDGKDPLDSVRFVVRGAAAPGN